MSVVPRIGARAGTALVASALAASLLASTPASAAGSNQIPERKAAGWLAGQLRDGVMHNGQYDFDDYGLTIDAGFALKALRQRPAAVHRIRTALKKNAAAYTTFQDDVYAGATAKLLVFARETGGSARDFGGLDLVTQLKGLVIRSGPASGRLQDKSSSGDFANTLSQAYAVQGLKPGGAVARQVRNFLLAQQCSAGYFRLDFATSVTSKKQSCDAAPRAKRQPDTDVTAIATLALLASHDTSKAVHRSVTKALGWLARHEGHDGSFGGGPTTAAANTNSTGLAAWALGVGGRCRAAQKAAGWVIAYQLSGDTSGTPLEKDAGAIAYDGKALKQGSKHGITKETRDQWRRATAQAAPALPYYFGGHCSKA